MSFKTEPNTITRWHEFACIDGHTCGNPVRLVTSGHPALIGATMSEKRQDFIKRFDWVRTALMYEPRGHDIMSGAFLYPTTRDDCDTGIIYIEVSGCLPMCGHGTIGTVTLALEAGLVEPKAPGVLVLDAPAGVIKCNYDEKDGKITSVKLTNVPSYLAKEGLVLDCPDLGKIKVDIAFGGNFYAIIDRQKNFAGLENISANDIQRLSPIIRKLANEKVEVVHPEDATIKGVSHVMWTGAPTEKGADGKNAVFYGDKGIDRSPCGTGTSARMAQLAAKGTLKPGNDYIHESIIGSLFKGRVEAAAKVGDFEAIVPSITGWAFQTGKNKISVDPADPFWRGFQVK
ncbi:MAG: 4-hydroxyproline epimerase [Sphingomonadales bacterium]